MVWIAKWREKRLVKMNFLIKKSAISVNSQDARPSRWTGGERLDCAIAELELEKRKVRMKKVKI